MDAVVEKTDKAVRATIEGMGYEIVDIEYAKRPDNMYLIVYIDIPRGVTLDDCEQVHNAINPIMDELDPVEGAYVLNVSSPGLDRPFKKRRDYERNYKKEVEIKLYAPLQGKKYYEGVLKEKTENAVVIDTEKGELTIEDTRIACVRPLVKFD